MEDRLSLDEFYDGVLEEVNLHLIHSYRAVKVSYDIFNNSKYRGAFRIPLFESDAEIIIGIPYNYPDIFPTVVIPDPFFSKLYPIPHLSVKHVLCTFDDNQAHPNAAEPLKVLDAVIERAQDLIINGISKKTMGIILMSSIVIGNKKRIFRTYL
jgi:hypothetical protein